MEAIKAENDERQKISSYQFDSIIENIKKTADTTKQILYISVSMNIASFVVLIIVLLVMLGK